MQSYSFVKVELEKSSRSSSILKRRIQINTPILNMRPFLGFEFFILIHQIKQNN